MDYIIAAKFTHPIQRLLHDCSNWIILDPGIEICEQMYLSNSWEKPRRMIVVRQKQNDKLVLKIALNKKRRTWFSGLWNYSKVLNYPFEIPIP